MLNKSAVIYRFECHCGNDYVGKTSRRFVDRIKEHVPPCVKNFIRDPFDNYLQDTTLCNASKKSSVAKHLLENFDTCGKMYSLDKFRILRNCKTDFQLSVCEAVNILILEPSLCVQQKFDFTTSLIWILWIPNLNGWAKVDIVTLWITQFLFLYFYLVLSCFIAILRCIFMPEEKRGNYSRILSYLLCFYVITTKLLPILWMILLWFYYDEWKSTFETESFHFTKD